MRDAIKFWDNAAEKYAKSPIQDIKNYEYTLGRTKSYLARSDQVLEIGCGTGSTALLLAPTVQHVTATDLSGNMIEIAKRKAHEQDISNATFSSSNLFDTSLDTGPYDAVLALNLIHLLEDIPAAMKRISELVKPGGVFISKTVCKPNKSTAIKIRLMLMALPLAQLFGRAPFVKFLEISELDQHITDAGFKIIETSNSQLSLPTRYIVAKKQL